MHDSSIPPPIRHPSTHKPTTPVGTCPLGRARLFRATMVTTLEGKESKWEGLGDSGSWAPAAREKAFASSSGRFNSIYSAPSSNCSSEASPRAAHLELSPSAIELSEKQELVELVSGFALDSWRGENSESAFDSLWVQ